VDQGEQNVQIFPDKNVPNFQKYFAF